MATVFFLVASRGEGGNWPLLHRACRLAVHTMWLLHAMFQHTVVANACRVCQCTDNALDGSPPTTIRATAAGPLCINRVILCPRQHMHPGCMYSSHQNANQTNQPCRKFGKNRAHTAAHTPVLCLWCPIHACMLPANIHHQQLLNSSSTHSTSMHKWTVQENSPLGCTCKKKTKQTRCCYDTGDISAKHASTHVGQLPHTQTQTYSRSNET